MKPFDFPSRAELLARFQPFPRFDVGYRVGHAEHIDYLKWDEVPHPVMWGEDIFGRLFVVVKTIVAGNTLVMQTFFQRYRRSEKHWASGNHATRRNLLKTDGGGMTQYQMELVSQLAFTGSAVLNLRHRPSGWPAGTVAALFKEAEWNAARAIQRAWRRCRYTPGYQMCSRVQFRNHFQIEAAHGRSVIK